MGEIPEGFEKELQEKAKAGFEKAAETKTQKAEMTVVLFCKKCSKEEPFPLHCDQQMELEEAELTCGKCDHKIKVPECCGEPMVPKIK